MLVRLLDRAATFGCSLSASTMKYPIGGLVMSSDEGSIPPRSPATKQIISTTPAMLTPSEVEELLRAANETSNFARKAFSKDQGKA
jgi:hypothetical protein